jgi:CheY-like chemotaxis protein
MMESKEVHLQVEMPDPPPLAFADRTVLRQVCLNLLSYAFDASEDGTVLLQVREQPEAAQFTVKTATQPGGKTPAGRTGLGLNVVRQLVEAQGGSLHIQTEETALWSATVDLPKAQRLSILVVDDNSAIINLFQRYLARSKYKVVGAETGQKALQLASQIKPAAITLDVMMPSQDGWETLQALKAMPELQGTPVIVCSILNEPDLAYALGADDFLRKPISQTSLLQTLDRWLARSSGGTPMRPGAPADSETAQPG